MKNKPAKILSALMIAAMLLGLATALQIVHAAGTGGIPQPDAYIVVNPAVSSFPPPSMTIGSTFDVNVSLVNITNVGGVEFTLDWNSSLLNCTHITEVLYHTWTPSGDWSNIWSLELSYNNSGGYALYSQAWLSLTEAEADGSGPGNVTTTNFPATNGECACATFTFEVIQLPTLAIPTLSCLFSLSGVEIATFSSSPLPIIDNSIKPPTGPIGNDPINGTYSITWTAPSIYPYFSVDSFTATSLNQIFNVSVYVNNLDQGWEAVGFQFTLEFNSSLLSLVSVSLGPWLTPFGASGNDQGVLPLIPASGFDPSTGLDTQEVAGLVLPDTHGVWWAPFPSAPNPNTVPFAEFEFNVTMQGVFPTTLTSPLDFYDCVIGNWLAQPVATSAPVNGIVTIMPSIVGRVIDIYTQWPAPYGGQGLDQPSDMFWPQKSVQLFANVTYNGYAEQQKEVAFQIIAPNSVNNDNETWAVLYATTNASGIATVTFTLPWPCNDPQQWFGVWTVIGTVDIACTIVNDTLWFHYDYLTEIFKQTTDMTSYTHEDIITVTIDYGTYLQETDATYYDPLTGTDFALSNVTVVVTGLDNLLVPFTFIGAAIPLETAYTQYGNGSILEANFGGAPELWTSLPLPFSNYINYTVTLTIAIPKYAAAGEAELECAILNTWPSLGGTVISGYYDALTNTWLPYCPTYIDILAS